jgi:hypothetical protein
MNACGGSRGDSGDDHAAMCRFDAPRGLLFDDYKKPSVPAALSSPSSTSVPLTFFHLSLSTEASFDGAQPPG